MTCYICGKSDMRDGHWQVAGWVDGEPVVHPGCGEQAESELLAA